MSTRDELLEEVRWRAGEVRELEQRLEASRVRYRESLVAARSAGFTFAQIAAAAGVTRQSVYQLLRRATVTRRP